MKGLEMKTESNSSDSSTEQHRQVIEGYTRVLNKSLQRSDSGEAGPKNSCCGGYTPDEILKIPEEAAKSSFGCGNPLKFADVREGQTVLDIGSGAGIDCFLAADRVGPRGRVIGLDMTPAMVEKARMIGAEKGYANVEFRLGTAERMPVEDSSVDWIVSNCVINLSPDKAAVFREASRVLKPDGRVSISDILIDEKLPDEILNSMEAYIGCLAGAIREADYLDAMRQAGLTDVRVTSRFVYDADTLRGWFGGTGSCQCGSGTGSVAQFLDQYADQLANHVWSAEIEAVKP